MGLFSKHREPIQTQVVQALSSVDTKQTLLNLSYDTEKVVFELGDILPIEGAVYALQIIDIDRKILEVSPEDIPQPVSFLLRKTMEDYLLTLIRRYELTVRSNAEVNPEEFTKQVKVILESFQDTFDDVKTDNVRKLESQGLFLEAKFGGSDLE